MTSSSRGNSESYRFKVLHHNDPAAYAEAQIETAPVSAMKKTEAGGTVEATMSGLVTTDSTAGANTQAMNDIVMSYPARAMVGVGLTAPYGAKVLFGRISWRGLRNHELFFRCGTNGGALMRPHKRPNRRSLSVLKLPMILNI